MLRITVTVKTEKFAFVITRGQCNHSGGGCDGWVFVCFSIPIDDCDGNTKRVCTEQLHDHLYTMKNK